MSIVGTDLVAYAAANMPEDDTSLNGGAVNPLNRVVFTDLAANDSVEVLSDNGSDTTQHITVAGRKASGASASQTVTLNGLTAVPLSTLGTIERVQKALLDADCAGTITVRRSAAGPTIGTIPHLERGFTRLFINAVSDPSNPKPYYMKFFWKNTHATLALLNAVIKQNADPTGKITHLLAVAAGDAATSANRITAPAVGDTQDPDAFDDTDKYVPGTDLAPTVGIGCWLKFSLVAAENPIKNTYTSEMDGSTV